MHNEMSGLPLMLQAIQGHYQTCNVRYVQLFKRALAPLKLIINKAMSILGTFVPTVSLLSIAPSLTGNKNVGKKRGRVLKMQVRGLGPNSPGEPSF